MPNWCENDLFIIGERVLECLNKIRGEDGGEVNVIDFNKIIPMPECLKETISGSEVAVGLIILGKADPMIVNEYLKYEFVIQAGVKTEKELQEFLRNRSPKAVDIAQKSLRAYKETGHNDWYSWSNANWGTKWNVSDCKLCSASDKRALIKFSTAWSPPKKVIITLSSKFPALTFILKYYERGMAFKGTLKVVNGRILIDKDSPYKGNRGG